MEINKQKCSSVSSIEDLRTGVSGLIHGLANFFMRIDDCHGDRIHSFLTLTIGSTTVRGNAASSLERKLYRALAKKLQESMDRFTCWCDN